MINRKFIKFLVNHFPALIPVREEIITASMKTMPNNYLVFEKMGEPVFMCSFVAVSNTVYAHLIEEPSILKDHSFLSYALSNPGKNVHFILAAGQAMPYALKAVRIVRRRYDPHTVSWYSPKGKFKLAYRRKSINACSGRNTQPS